MCISLFICLVFSVGNQTQGFVPALYMLTHGAIPQSAFLNLSTISELWRPIWAYPKRQTGTQLGMACVASGKAGVVHS